MYVGLLLLGYKQAMGFFPLAGSLSPDRAKESLQRYEFHQKFVSRSQSEKRATD
jgi:hypothetical protein